MHAELFIQEARIPLRLARHTCCHNAMVISPAHSEIEVTNAFSPTFRASLRNLRARPDGNRGGTKRSAAARGANWSPSVLSRRQNEGRAAQNAAQPVHRGAPQHRPFLH